MTLISRPQLQSRVGHLTHLTTQMPLSSHFETSMKVNFWLTDFPLNKTSFQKTQSGDNFLKIIINIYQIIAHLPSYTTINLELEFIYLHHGLAFSV